MKVLASACVPGCNCEYNGRNSRDEAVIECLKGKEVLNICPETLANMSIPRPCAEAVDEAVMDDKGNNVDSNRRKAVALVLERIEGEKVDLAILQSRNSTCGVSNIYDGTFTGELISGQGLFIEALIIKGYPIKDAEDFSTQI